MRGMVGSLIIVCVCVCARVEAGTYSGGNGTEGDPYLIAGANDIIEMSNTSADWGAHYLMIADIDMGGYMFERAVIAADEDDTNYSEFDGTAFGGAFDGGGHNILNLSVGAGGWWLDRNLERS